MPERARRELRELTRYRTSLIRERAAEVNRLQKVLEGANITDELVCQGDRALGFDRRAIGAWCFLPGRHDGRPGSARPTVARPKRLR